MKKRRLFKAQENLQTVVEGLSSATDVFEASALLGEAVNLMTSITSSISKVRLSVSEIERMQKFNRALQEKLINCDRCFGF